MKYQYSDSTQITPHFNAKEFRCKCGKVHEFGISNELVNKLEKLYTALKARLQASTAMWIWISATRIFPQSSRIRD